MTELFSGTEQLHFHCALKAEIEQQKKLEHEKSEAEKQKNPELEKTKEQMPELNKVDNGMTL